MPKAILVVSPSSFLARAALEALAGLDVRLAHHHELDRAELVDGIGCVVSFARDPRLSTPDYRIDDDVELGLARRVAARDARYVFLSTRKVYALGTGPLSEDSPLGPTDAYGRNKLALEERLGALLGPRLTVLRLANIFGYEREPGRRTFLGLCLASLAREGRIVLDMSPFVERDFLPVGSFARVLARVVQAPPGGVLNVGSGIALACGRLVLWILEGFGRGELLVTSPEERDPFVLDIARLRARYGSPCAIEDLRAAALSLGRRLARDLAPPER